MASGFRVCGAVARSVAARVAGATQQKVVKV